MAYVPPAFRKKQQEPESKSEKKHDDSKPAAQQRRDSGNDGFHRERLPRAEDVHDHYWPSEAEEEGEGMRFTVHSTLNSSRSEPDALKYVVLFKDANPRWQSDRIVYVKTNLYLLPGSETFGDAVAAQKKEQEDPVNGEGEAGARQSQPPSEGGSSADIATHTPDLSAYHLEPVAVFEQVGSRSGGFRFAGYHAIARLQFLEPRSQDLVRMLEQKFSVVDVFGRVVRQQRSPEAWKASLEHRWAVLQLARIGDEEAEGKGLAAPDIKVEEVVERGVKKKKKGEEAPKKSVNEMLKEMRLGKAEGEAEERRPAWT